MVVSSEFGFNFKWPLTLENDLKNFAYTKTNDFLARPHGCGILLPGSGIEPTPPAVEVQSLNHGTTREVPKVSDFLK